jgi:hypothetical protein
MVRYTSTPTAVLACPTDSEIPREINDELVRQLASFYNAPAKFAASSIALLGFGSRAVLEDQGMIRLRGSWPSKIIITDYGWQVMAACAHFASRAKTADWHRCRDFEDEPVSTG